MSVGVGRYRALVMLPQWFTHCVNEEVFEELPLAHQTVNSVLFLVTLVLLTFYYQEVCVRKGRGEGTCVEWECRRRLQI